MRKRVMAFILICAMLCINFCKLDTERLCAYAEGADTEEAGIYVKSVEEVKAGEQVTIEVVANKDMYWNAFSLCIHLDQDKLVTTKEAIQAIEANYDSESEEWIGWKSSTYRGVTQANFIDANGEYGDYYYIVSGVGLNTSAYIEKDTLLLSLVVEAKVDLNADDVIATCKLPEGYTDSIAGTEENEKGLAVDCVVTAKEEPVSPIDPAADPILTMKSVEEVKAGEQVTIEVVANKDMYWNTFILCIYLDPDKLVATKEAIQAIEANYDSESEGWLGWKSPTYRGVTQANFIDANGEYGDCYYIVAGAATGKSAYIEKDTLLLSLVVEARVDLNADDVIATCKLPIGYMDQSAGTEENEKGLAVDCIVTAKEEPVEDGEDVIAREEMEQLIVENETQDTVIQTTIGLTYIFEKGTMKAVDGMESYDFGAEINQEYDSLINPIFSEEEFAFQINYNYEGQLPGIARISIPVDSKWVGKRLYYYEIDENGEYKYVSRTTVAGNGTYTVKQKQGSSYVATTKVPEKLGDVDGEDGITAKDALAILKHDVGLPQENFVMEFADCDGEDGITAKDALAVLKYDVGLLKEFY